jgi:PAS domain S-box-containing protein
MLKPMHTMHGVVTLSFVRDATEQKAAIEVARRRDLQLRTIVESVREYAIYLLDKDGNIMTWNPGAERIKGYTADEMVGKHFSRFFSEEDRERGRPAELLRLAEEKGRVEQEAWRIRKDGSRFWADVIVNAIRGARGEVIGFSKVVRDNTDRKRAEESVMLQLSSALLSNMDVRKLLSAISASITEVIPHDAATLGLYDPATGELIVQFLAPDESGMHRSEVRLPLEGSPAGEAFRTRQPVILERMEKSGFSPEGMRHHVSIGMHAGLWVPLVHRGEPIGTLAVSSRREGAFSQHDAEMLTQIADHVARQSTTRSHSAKSPTCAIA